MKTSRLLLVTIFLVVTAAWPAFAADYYVDISVINGDVTGDGSALSPWQTLHRAAGVVTGSGHIIHVASGTYSVANGEFEGPLSFNLSNTTIQGDPGGGTVINATSPLYYWLNGIDLNACSNVIVRNIEIINAVENGVYVSGGSGNTITGCNLHDNYSQGVLLFQGSGHTVTNCNIHYNQGNGIIVDQGSAHTISNCQLHDNGSEGGDGVSVYDSSGMTIIGCSIYNNLTSGVQISNSDNTNAILRNRIFNNDTGVNVYSFDSNSSPNIFNNLIYGTAGSLVTGISVVAMSNGIPPGSASPTVYNNTIADAAVYGISLNADSMSNVAPDIQYNIITGCGTGIFASSFLIDAIMNAIIPETVDYNDFFGNTIDLNGVFGGTHCKYENPLYVNPTAGNYRLGVGSPCIDAAGPSPLTQDLAGNIRPQGAAPDMGCYEAVAVAPPPPASGISIIGPTEGLTTGEDGTSDTFKLVLNSQPTADVTISLASSDTGEGIVRPGTLTFTPYNWFILRTVTVKGVDDELVDGDIPYTVIINPAVSRDPLYDGLKASDISAVNIDDDRADIIVNPTEGLVTSKLGGSDTFTVVLGSKPMAVVTVDLSSSDTTAGIVSPDRLEFLPAYWNKPQTVKVTGQDDGTDGDVPYTVITAPAISDDTVYDGLDPDDVSVLNIDNLPPEPPQYVFPGPYHQFAPGQNINLQGSPFKDSDGDTHIGSLWWIWPASRDTGGCDNTPGFFEFFSDNALTSYNLPSNLLVPGVLYRWAVAYQDSGSGVFSWSDMSNNAQNLFIVGKEETYVAPPFPPGDSAADFRMLSCHHYILGNPLATAVIGDDLDGGVYDTRYYRIGTYDPLLGGGGYLEYPNFMLAPGTGVWILARNGLTVDITGIPVTTEEDVELELTFNESNNNGWNMIGPPNDRDYTWANVVLVSYGINDSCAPSFGPVRIGSLDPDNPYIDIRLWEWNGDDYVLATMLETDKGYWVKVKRKDIFLRFPVDAQVAWNNPDMMLAAGADKIKKTAVELVSPRKALAEDTGEGPPRPMAVIEDGGDTGTFASSGSGNCFIDTMNYR